MSYTNIIDVQSSGKLERGLVNGKPTTGGGNTHKTEYSGSMTLFEYGHVLEHSWSLNEVFFINFL